MGPKASALWRHLRSYQLYGANTDVGKTVMSTILCKALTRIAPAETVWYLKPVSTGPLSQADDRHIKRYAPKTHTRCLFQFDEPVSPHIAAARSGTTLKDAIVLREVLGHLALCAQSGPGSLLLETAGGVHSPAPSGNSQANVYRLLRLPILLVADPRLGGISSTISAFESLHIRGYDVDSVLVFEDSKYRNHKYFQDYFRKRSIPTMALPPPPRQEFSETEDRERMSEYYEKASAFDVVEETVSGLFAKHTARVDKLQSMASRAHQHIWYPFTQHRSISPSNIVAIDSAYGDFFQTYMADSPRKENEERGLLQPAFDGSASWWTQGVGHGNPDLSLAAAYAAGRYGHVMFAGMVHEPAISLAELLMQKLRNPRLHKVFYSDNGSTGIEVAMKMALTAAAERYGWDARKRSEIGVLGFKGSYHGDTIGAMDCSEPSTFNEKVHWYQGRGYWFDVPQAKMKNGVWMVEIPPEMGHYFDQPTVRFNSLGGIFDIVSRKDTVTARRYTKYVQETLAKLQEERKTFGALIMEPVILGAGGMILVDPLFQHILAQVVRASASLFNPNSPSSQRLPPASQDSLPHSWTGLPIIHDEVFTGLFRLGRFSSSTFIRTHPDISVHAKLLTGGLVPLAATLASETIFNAFVGADTRDALLHGHSYTAHAVGCEVARRAVGLLVDMAEKGGEDGWDEFRRDWKEDEDGASDGRKSGLDVPDRISGDECVWSVWSKDFVTCISHAREVESVIALGSVLAISLRTSDGAGYTSTAARGLQAKVLQGPSSSSIATEETAATHFKIHARVLGNVFYLMAAQTTTLEEVREIERIVGGALGLDGQ